MGSTPATTGKAIHRDADSKFPWWAVTVVVVVGALISAAFITVIVLCWHYHAEHEAGDARAGNMEQCLEAVYPFPSLSSMENASTHKGTRSHRPSRRSADGLRSRQPSGASQQDALFSNPQRVSSLQSAFHAQPS